MLKVQYPKDLAIIVCNELRRKNVSKFSDSVLTSVFETMYFSSIQTEEAQSIVFNVVYLEKDTNDRVSTTSKLNRGWSAVEFATKIPFNVSNVLKLAKASDPRTSSLAICHNDEDIYIWGLIDQDNGFYDFLNYESEERPSRPGLFQASLEGPGNIVAYSQYTKIAELIVNRIVRRTVDVFSQGPIFDVLQSGFSSHLKSVERKISPDKRSLLEDFEYDIQQYWFSTICRLILRIKSYRHGGALLLSNVRPQQGLNVKYPVSYDRVRSLLTERAIYDLNFNFTSGKIFDCIDEGDFIDSSDYQYEKEAERNLDVVRKEIDSSLWFVSLLSRVDGLVLLNKRLDVKGFGVEIKTSKLPGEIYSCNSQKPLIDNLKMMDYNHFGTRHRSMMRYCWHYPQTVGIVISQDGDVRAITRCGEKLIVWENIKLQAFSFVSRKRLKRRLSK